ncbi:MAG: Wzy polymerase domain-containing protein [Burkholderiaceae bacterium]
MIATRSTGLPGALALSSCGLVGAALALLLAAQGLDAPARQRWCEAFCWGLLAAGLLSLIVGLVQVFLPAWADGTFIARSGIPGRAVGNMRQPNHLASLLMWACVAAVYLADQGRLNRLNGRKGLNGLKASAPVALPLPLLLFALVFAVVLSASRTGMVGVLVLAAWGLLDRKLQRATRWALIATPLMLALSWGLLAVWAGSGGGHAFGAESRLSEEGAGSPSRLAILANAWALVKMHPLAGVGWGGFNFAWTMTPFPNRPIAFFDHTHDLPMQLAVELGLPLALLILGLLGWSLWRALRMSMRAQGGDAVARRCTFMMVITIGLHSLLEYPLWYAYFLLPAAFAFGLSLGRLDGADAPQRAAARDISLPLRLAGLLMIAGSAFAVWDYLRIVDIYAPKANAASLEQRIAIGQRSPFFSALADYAAATSLPPGPAALAAARRTAHNLIDVRLMMAWAKSLEATGDVDRARYVVQRLREFRSREGADWLAECAAFKPQERKPFQCEPPSREYRYEEMR